jgi:putative SOS response-associated peptidase YedK
MCGRYTIHSASETIKNEFGITQLRLPFANYNIAPTTIQPVVHELPGMARTVSLMRWDFTPSWQSHEKKSSVLINARIETINDKPSFRAIKDRRCLVIADGYFEWKLENGLKQPYYITQKSKLPFAFAGIWERNIAKEPMDSYAIITVPAREGLADFHDRMPAILQKKDYGRWLNPGENNWENLKVLLETYPIENLEVYPVTRKVNNSRYEFADTILPLRDE